MYKYLLINIFLLFAVCFQWNKQISLELHKTAESAFINQPVQVKDYSKLTDEDFKALIESSNIGYMQVFQKNPLDVNTDGEFTYLLFGSVPNTVFGLQHRYCNMFTIEKQEITIKEMNDTVMIVNKLKYKNSFLKVYFNGATNTNDIVSGKIENMEIGMALGIHIGIPKKDFFNKIFAKGSNVDFHALDTFRNMNGNGEIKQEFVFKADTLNKVILTSDYDWIPFDL